MERGLVTKSQEGKMAYVERKVGECFSGRHMDNVPKETHVVFSHDRLVQGDLYGGQRRKGRSSSPANHLRDHDDSTHASAWRKSH